MGSLTSRVDVLWGVTLGAALMVVTSGLAVACSSAGTKVESADSGPVKSDASSDAGTSPDVVADVGPCEPASVSGFAPTPNMPTVQPACSDINQIPQFIAKCYSDAGSEEACVTWQLLEGNFICNAQCLNTGYAESALVPGGMIPPPAPGWGPTVHINNPGSSNWLNVGGCVGIADPDGGAACATALTNSFECEYYACAAVPGCSIPQYPASAEPRLKALQACFTAAGSGVCSSYADKVTSACASYTGAAADAGADAGPAAFCFNAATDTTALTTMITQACGGGDGGGYKN